MNVFSFPNINSMFFSLILNSFRPEMGHAAHGTYPYQVSLDDLSLALGEVEAMGFVFFWMGSEL